jgi:hypothetical protein
MKIARSVFSVILGYLVFALSAFAFFLISGQPPHQEAPTSVMLGSIAVGLSGAFAGGFLAAVLAGRRPLAHAVAVAMVMAAGAIFSLISTLGRGAIWTQLSALGVMVPAAVMGGIVRARQRRGDESARG